MIRTKGGRASSYQRGSRNPRPPDALAFYSTDDTSLARQIESAVDWPDRVEGAGVAALERHLARPVVVDPVLRSPVFLSALINSIIICVRMAVILVFK